jgi:predicted secreted protein
MFLNYSASAVEIASALVGKTVRYLAEKSSIKKDGVRVLKIEAVDHVGFSKDGKRFVTVKALDIDDGGESKFRNLHIAGIDLAV